MPEAEWFKILIQLGSFGALLYGVIWALKVGWPEARDTIRILAEKHAATENVNSEKHEAMERLLAEKIESSVNRIEACHAEAVTALADRHERAVATLVGEQTKLVQKLDANCREERLHFAQLLATTMPAK